MAYYTGQCSSYQHLADILVEKCQAHGWAWQDNILSKDDLFIKIDVNQTNKSTIGAGICLTGGASKTGMALSNASATTVRLGSPHTTLLGAIFPAKYHCFVFDDEVYCVAKVAMDRYFYLAFGKSALTQATGLWLSTTACYYTHTYAVSISDNSGGAGGAGNPSAVAPFFNRYTFGNNWSNAVICHGYDGTLWSSGTSKAYASFEPLISRLPTAHFSDSPLLPYNIYLERPENKISLIAQFEHARFVRIDNYEPEQILTLGHEKWIVFPFLSKNAQAKNGGSRIDHTGTFGWAIRYEG